MKATDLTYNRVSLFNLDFTQKQILANRSTKNPDNRIKFFDVLSTITVPYNTVFFSGDSRKTLIYILTLTKYNNHLIIKQYKR